MAKMRIPIREQLGFLVIISSLVGLAVIAIATWVTNHNFVLDIRSSRLYLTASLKAAQMASNLLLMQSSVKSVSSRVIIQNSLRRYNGGNNSVENWTAAQPDLQAAVEGGQQIALILQAQIFPKDASGPAGSSSILNATGSGIAGLIRLPYTSPNGLPVYLGDPGLGFPPNLYPNLTYGSTPVNDSFSKARAFFGGQVLDESSTLLLGPWQINKTFSLASMTVPIINNTSSVDILGWLSVVLDARLIIQVLSAKEGLDQTGSAMLVGPTNVTNRFASGVRYDSNKGSPPDNVEVHFVIAPNNTFGRHPTRAYGTTNAPFNYNAYPAVKEGFTRNEHRVNNAGSLVSTNNEEGRNVAVGFALPDTDMCDWLVIVEQSHDEVWAPINHLRNILLACVFGTVGAMLLLAFPIAHYSSAPIRRLRDATRKTVAPPGIIDEDDSIHPSSNENGSGEEGDDAAQVARKEGFLGQITQWRHRSDQTPAERKEEARRRAFRIPSKVKDRKHFIQDELTDLTQTFNEMSDELMMQYERLEERVQQRTAELELSKKAAEAANESKTLFIANISHELKTPLNGILGMTAVCMSEDDPAKIKRSLGIIYKSGDLLLNLLTDLLTFSKNQVGQYLSLDEKEFRLRDVSSQVLAIFDKQSKEGKIDLRVVFEGPIEANVGDGFVVRNPYGPLGTGRVKDMLVWGDYHRILQVVINLVSNSLKFTPPGGSVVLTIRCTGDTQESLIHGSISRQSSMASKQISGHRSLNRSRIGSGSQMSVSTPAYMNTANEINALEKPKPPTRLDSAERSPSPPPGRMLSFEFEVRDTGPGIPEHLHDKIFEPFVQGDLGLSKKYGGTGLGLSICSQLAGLMKGTMRLESEVGQGSTFTMQIPLRHLTYRAGSTASSSIVSMDSRRNSLSADGLRTSPPAADDAISVRSATLAPGTANASPAVFEQDSQPRLVGLSAPFFASSAPLESPGSQQAAMERVAAEASQRGKGKIRVLVAEDNKTNQEVVLRMLKLEDIFDVTVAQGKPQAPTAADSPANSTIDGQEAYDLVKESMEKQHPYNLIFMDIQMPNLDGLHATRLIREAGYSAPIVALSAYAEDTNVKECIDSGMNDFISKPIRRPRLKQVLKTFIPPVPIPEGDEAESSSASRTLAQTSQPTAAASPHAQQSGALRHDSPPVPPGSQPAPPRSAIQSIDLPEPPPPTGRAGT